MSYTKNPEHSTNILTEAIKNRSLTVFPKYYSNFPDKWDHFINFIDYGAIQPFPKERDNEADREHEEFNKVYRKGLIAWYGYMTIMADRASEEFFPGLEEIKSGLVSVFKKDINGTMVLISLSRAEKVLDRHEDPTDNIYLQCVGSVTWRIYEKNSQEYVDYVLGPGDLMFLPQGTSHEVFPNGARAAIVFTFRKDI
jgi:hypothetical protein